MTTSDETEKPGAVKQVAKRIGETLIAPGFEVETEATVLLINALLAALFSGHRIYLNAFQRSGEVVNYFGHRLHRYGFDVHLLDPRSIIPAPRARDVLICLSGSLRTEPVLVSLMHAELEGLYKFVVTAQAADETRKKFQGVLPVNIPGVTSEGKAADDELSSILPLGSLFELRAFLYLEAVSEILGQVLDHGERSPSKAARLKSDKLDPSLMVCLTRVRAQAERVPELMRDLLGQFLACVDAIEDEQLDGLLEQLKSTVARKRATYITGYGRNNEVGCMFVHRLASLSIPVALTPTRIERPTQPDDLIIALTGSGETYEVLQRMSGARRNGLRTAALTSVPASSVTRFSDTPVIIPARVEPRESSHFAELRLKPSPPARPSQSTFSLNALLTLESVFAALMAELGKKESDLTHTDPWQGFDSPL